MLDITVSEPLLRKTLAALWKDRARLKDVRPCDLKLHLVATSGVLTAILTDGAKGVRQTMDAEIRSDGSCSLPLKAVQLAAMFKDLTPDVTIRFSEDGPCRWSSGGWSGGPANTGGGRRAVIVCGPSEYTLHSVPDVPDVQFLDDPVAAVPKVKFTRTTIQVHLVKTGPVHVIADVTGPIAVHRQPQEDGALEGKYFVVTHVPTGLSIRGGLLKAEARALAARIATCDVAFLLNAGTFGEQPDETWRELVFPTISALAKEAA